jgi:hypothetical protein
MTKAEQKQMELDALEEKKLTTPDGEKLEYPMVEGDTYVIGSLIPFTGGRVHIVAQTGLRRMAVFIMEALIREGSATGASIYHLEIVEHEWRYVKLALGDAKQR